MEEPRRGRAGDKPGVPKALTERGRMQRVMKSHPETVPEQERVRWQIEHAKDPAALPELVDRYVRIAYEKATGGDPSALDAKNALQMTTKEMLRQELVAKISGNVLFDETMVDPLTGRELGKKLRVNPGFEALKWIDDQLGLTAEQMRLTRKSRGEGARDDAIAERMRHDDSLRAADKRRLPEPDESVL